MSFTTFSLTMQDMKSGSPAPTGHSSWQGYRVPLPAPSSRLSQPYESTAPLSAPLVLLYNGGAKDHFNPMNLQQQHDMQPRRSSESLMSAGSKLNAGLTSHRSYPALKRPYESLEENPYGNINISPIMHDGLSEFDNSAKPTIQSDHRLLSFGALPPRHTVLDQYGAPAKVDVAAQIHGMFFLSEMATHTGDSIIMQAELTCYRRNLFQISGSVTCPAGPLSVLTDRGESMPIMSQELAVSAMESVDGHVIRLIVIPWKTPPANSPEIPTGQEQEPAPIPINFDSSENEDKTNGTVSQAIAWRRLQFRVATANNGRRKELQQHFVLRLKLMSTLADGSKVCTSESTTAPIVVRGRSPRNFQARKEIPLLGSSASPRGQASQVSPTQKRAPGAEKMVVGKPGMIELPKRPFQFDTSNFPPSPFMVRNGYSQWNPPQQHHPEHGVATTTPTYPQVTNSMPPYLNNVQMLQPLQQTSAAPTISQAASIDAPSRHYYSSSPSLSAQFDPNPRPKKSPRHTDMSSSSLYQSFDSQYANSMPGAASANRLYYPHAPAPESWQSTEHAASGYATSLQPPSQQPPPPQSAAHHQHQPAQHTYSYPTEGYPGNRDDGQNIGYTWSTAG